MNRKYISMIMLVAVLLISLSLSAYSCMVSTHTATLPSINPTEGYEGIKPAVQTSETPVEASTPSEKGLSASSFSSEVIASTSGQTVATNQEMLQKKKQQEADRITAF